MTKRIFITGMGVMSSSGNNLEEFKKSIKLSKSGIAPITLFPTPEDKLLPVGEIKSDFNNSEIPRTHQIALKTISQFMNPSEKPDAIIIGVTTGGMPLTEELLKKEDKNSDNYSYHGTGTVAEYLAEKTGCTGPVITISTACSSGAAAIKIAFDLLKSGGADTVLTGGIDSLCRLTYFGFNSLQVIDPEGAKPLDKKRSGMTVAEGAGLLSLKAADTIPLDAIAEVSGGGLSCDAHHPASPHPEGAGAYSAMKKALENSGITSADIDYINLHGTGTIDNDLAESKAVKKLFGDNYPSLSSIKGITGHSLAASGAIEAVLGAMIVSENFIPGNYGCTEPDTDISVVPELIFKEKNVNCLLSNSFGFGGNNASIVISKPGIFDNIIKHKDAFNKVRFSIKGISCLTGAGNLNESIDSLSRGKRCSGVLSLEKVSQNLNLRSVRRMKRLPRMVMALADAALQNSVTNDLPESVYFGTAWGPVSETFDFLSELFKSNEQFTSPTNFVGSVHNAPAGNVAVKYKSTGTNITTTGDNISFEQAFFSASLLSKKDEILLLVAADEYHEKLTSIFDISSAKSGTQSDGGGAFLLKQNGEIGPFLSMKYFVSLDSSEAIEKLIVSLGGKEAIIKNYSAVFVGLPAAYRKKAEPLFDQFIVKTQYSAALVDYRKHIGDFGTASAVAASLAVSFIQKGEIPEYILLDSKEDLKIDKGILFISFDKFITAFDIMPL